MNEATHLLRSRPGHLRPTSVAGRAVSFAVLIAFPFAVARVSLPMSFPVASLATVMNLALIAIVGAGAFNLLVGTAGQFSLAHAGFMASGAVIAAWVGEILGRSLAAALVASFVGGLAIGTVVGLPSVRLRGVYLLLSTIGVHFACVFLFKKFQIANFGYGSVYFEYPELPTWTGFAVGDDRTISSPFRWYWVLLPITLACCWVMGNLTRGAFGRGLVAVRDRDLSASLYGLNPAVTKLTVFALSAAFASLAGGLGAVFVGAVSEESYTIDVVLDFAVIIVVGGLGTVRGAVLGAGFFYLTPVVLDWLWRRVPPFDRWSMLQDHSNELTVGLFGVAIVVILLFFPGGLAAIRGPGLLRRVRGEIS